MTPPPSAGTTFLSTEDLLTLVADLGVGPVRDLGLIEAAAARPRTSLFGADAYADLALKAAALLESLVRNHPLVDGNKRLGWLACVVVCDLNGEPIDAPDDDAYELVIAVAEGRVDVATSAAQLQTWMPTAKAG